MRGQPRNTPTELVQIEYDGRNGRKLTKPLLPQNARGRYNKLLKEGKNPHIRKCKDDPTTNL